MTVDDVAFGVLVIFGVAMLLELSIDVGRWAYRRWGQRAPHGRCMDCQRPLTEDERYYYDVRCEPCEGRAFHQLQDDL